MMEKRNARLNTEQKRTLLILVIIGVLYFCALIPANLTGAETADMLDVFEVDEYAQYPHLIRMLTPSDSLYQTLRNFFIYLHYYYGYPFYFWSAIFVLPLKLIPGVFPDNTRVIVCVLRQCISVLPMILSAGLLVWIATACAAGGISSSRRLPAARRSGRSTSDCISASRCRRT